MMAAITAIRGQGRETTGLPRGDVGRGRWLQSLSSGFVMCSANVMLRRGDIIEFSTDNSRDNCFR